MSDQLYTTELSIRGREVVQGLRNVRDEIKALRAVEEDLKTQLLVHLDGHDQGLIDGAPVVQVDTIFRERFDAKRARENPIYADMMAACSTSTQYSQVRLL